MHLSINKLKVKPNYILVDGNKFKAFKKIPHKCVVKGDSKFLNIAAASILAKTFRDKLMENYHMKYPEFMRRMKEMQQTSGNSMFGGGFFVISPSL